MSTESTVMPEPPNQAFVLVGDIPCQALYQRDDEEAQSNDWDDHRWFNTADGSEAPEDWGTLARQKPQRMYLRDDLPMSAVAALDAAERAGAVR